MSTTDWTRGALSFTTSATTTQVTIFCFHNSGSGTADCDDISLTKNAPIVVNGGLETGALSPWAAWNSATVTSTAHSGSFGVRVGASPASAEQIIPLWPNTTYTLTGWAKVSATGNAVEIGIKNYGGSQLVSSISATAWTQGSLTFTTGSTTTQATIFCCQGRARVVVRHRR